MTLTWQVGNGRIIVYCLLLQVKQFPVKRLPWKFENYSNFSKKFPRHTGKFLVTTGETICSAVQCGGFGLEVCPRAWARDRYPCSMMGRLLCFCNSPLDTTGTETFLHIFNCWYHDPSFADSDQQSSLNSGHSAHVVKFGQFVGVLACQHHLDS